MRKNLFNLSVFLFALYTVPFAARASDMSMFSAVPDPAQPAASAQKDDFVLKLEALTPSQDVVNVLADAWQHGMNPDNYEAARLAAGFDKEKDDPAYRKLYARSVLTYIRDMGGMRVSAKDMGLRARDWRHGLDAQDAAAYFVQNGANDRALLLLAPITPLYKKLQDALAQERTFIKDGKGDQAIYPFGKIAHSLHVGDTHPAVSDLRQRLGVRESDPGMPDKYDDVLARVVMAFQRNHGLKEDGIIGPQTIGFFNQTHFERYRQIVANLERLRWLEPVQPDRYVVVNIPAATLWAVDGGKATLEMPVIVGRKDRPTPQFRTAVQGVRFNPTWTVPDVVKKQDFLPELQKNPEFLKAKGVRVFERTDSEEGQQQYAEIDPSIVNWAAVTEADLPKYRMVQPAGRSNALGKVRILMPNEYDVYLHDTNTPEYFRTGQARSLSSGCIRLSQPLDMARFTLAGMAEASGMDGTIKTGKMRDVMIESPFPVILLYQTAWLQNGENLVLAYDVYEEDIKLYNRLAREGRIEKINR